MADCLVITYNCGKTAKSVSGIQNLYSDLTSKYENLEYIAILLQEVAPIFNAVTNQIDAYLQPFIEVFSADFVFSLQENVGATALLLFTKQQHQYSDYQRSSIPFGIFWSSLKGAALISLENENERLTFVSLHLAANEGKVLSRNEDYKLLDTFFKLRGIQGDLIIGGDWNYRTSNGELSTDELRQEMERGGVANGLKEAEIEFDPTYKYITGTSALVRNRTPSWCDRILYRPSEHFKAVEYNSYPGLLESDHLPVYMAFISSKDTSVGILSTDSVESDLTVVNIPYGLSNAVNYSIAGFELIVHTHTGLVIAFIFAVIVLVKVVF